MNLQDDHIESLRNRGFLKDDVCRNLAFPKKIERYKFVFDRLNTVKYRNFCRSCFTNWSKIYKKLEEVKYEKDTSIEFFAENDLRIYFLIVITNNYFFMT